MTKLPVVKEDNKEIKKYDSEATLDLMDLIADGALTDTELPDLIDRDEVMNRTKLFLVAQAKTELKRIVKLTRFLDNIEERYQDELDRIGPMMELDDYSKAINTLNRCIDRSNKLVQSIINDDELTSILIVNNQSQVNNNVSVTENKIDLNGLDSPESRNRVVQAVDSILSQLKSKEEELENGKTE